MHLPFCVREMYLHNLFWNTYICIYVNIYIYELYNRYIQYTCMSEVANQFQLPSNFTSRPCGEHGAFFRANLDPRKGFQSNYSKSLIKMNPQWYNGSNAINPLDY